MLTFLVILGWLCSGVIIFGIEFAYWQGEYPRVDKAREDYADSVFFALFGLVGLIPSFLSTGFAKHGWRVRPAKKGCMMGLKPKCDMLIDQNKYIGSDPIGHCCFNDATLQNEEYFMCDECAESLRNKEGKVTFPPVGTVKMLHKALKGEL